MVRFKINTESDEPIKVELSVKGPKKVTSDDFKTNANIEVVSKGLYLCTLEKGGKLDLTVEVDRGRGYVPVEKRIDEQVSIGTMLIDSIYTPVKKVKFDVENARVGGMTNYNKLTMEISTDGAISPAEAIKTASEIMKEHLEVIIAATTEVAPKKAAKKKAEPKKAKK
jgi:DNA-directed RNA polymerase subunit alpha